MLDSVHVACGGYLAHPSQSVLDESFQPTRRLSVGLEGHVLASLVSRGER